MSFNIPTSVKLLLSVASSSRVHLCTIVNLSACFTRCHFICLLQYSSLDKGFDVGCKFKLPSISSIELSHCAISSLFISD